MSGPHGRGGRVTRRTVLAGLGTGLVGVGGASLIYESGAFTSAQAPRGVNISTASGSNALLGIVDQGPVKKNSRDPMADFYNNSGETLSITVTLDTPSEGTLYVDADNSGSSVTFSLAAGNTQIVDIEASVTGTITYSVSGSSPSFSIQTSGSVGSQAGNVAGAVVVHKPVKDQDFTANEDANEFEVKNVDVQDEQPDPNLDRVEFRVREGGSGGTVVGSFVENNPPADQYKPNGNPAIIIDTNGSYDITSGTTYSLTVTGYDADGNSDSSTVEDTAGDGGGGPPGGGGPA